MVRSVFNIPVHCVKETFSCWYRRWYRLLLIMKSLANFFASMMKSGEVKKICSITTTGIRLPLASYAFLYIGKQCHPSSSRRARISIFFSPRITSLEIPRATESFVSGCNSFWMREPPIELLSSWIPSSSRRPWLCGVVRGSQLFLCSSGHGLWGRSMKGLDAER